ncbi:Uncharacterised protein [Staphylococcus aureus]|nr:Uncharacterised protein [Staphylococcus aureus]
MIFQVFSPVIRAASTYSMRLISKTLARIVRANDGILPILKAIIKLGILAPNDAIIATANNNDGIANTTSKIRIIKLSI